MQAFKDSYDAYRASITPVRDEGDPSHKFPLTLNGTSYPEPMFHLLSKSTEGLLLDLNDTTQEVKDYLKKIGAKSAKKYVYCRPTCRFILACSCRIQFTELSTVNLFHSLYVADAPCR